MNFDTLHALELPFIQAIRSIATPLLDQFFIFLNIFDRSEVYFLLLPLVWVFISPLWSIRIFYLLILNSLINGALKMLFGEPRPVELDPALPMLNFVGFGFPSGSAQLAAIFTIILIKEWKKPIAIVCASLFFLLLSFSRVYLGAHFFSDVVAGWIVGAAIATAFYLFYERIENLIKKSPKELVFSLSTLFFLSFLFIARGHSIKIASFTAIGASLGLVLQRGPFPIGKTLLQKLFQALLTTLIIAFVYLLGIYLAATFPAHQFALESLSYLLVGLSCTYIVPYFFWKYK